MLQETVQRALTRHQIDHRAENQRGDDGQVQHAFDHEPQGDVVVVDEQRQNHGDHVDQPCDHSEDDRHVAKHDTRRFRLLVHDGQRLCGGLRAPLVVADIVLLMLFGHAYPPYIVLEYSQEVVTQSRLPRRSWSSSITLSNCTANFLQHIAQCCRLQILSYLFHENCSNTATGM